MLLSYFIIDFEKVPVVPIITGITFAFGARDGSVVEALRYKPKGRGIVFR
jgi:hypothetical protein